MFTNCVNPNKQIIINAHIQAIFWYKYESHFISGHNSNRMPSQKRRLTQLENDRQKAVKTNTCARIVTDAIMICPLESGVPFLTPLAPCPFEILAGTLLVISFLMS